MRPARATPLAAALLLGALALPAAADEEDDDETPTPAASRSGAGRAGQAGTGPGSRDGAGGSRGGADDGEDRFFRVYGKLYPEWTVLGYGEPSNPGTEVGHLTTQLNTRSVLTSRPAARPNVSDHDWSNSYVGVGGRVSAGRARIGYELQGLVDFQGGVRDNFRARDAYAYVAHPAIGRLAYGRMDSVYKMFGDRVRFLGISSGNFVGTSRMLSGVGWRGKGETTFHNRRSDMIAWVLPVTRTVDVGVSHSFDAVDGAPGRDPTLSAAGVRWRRGDWYAALATEVHRDWLPLSRDEPAFVPTSSSILNNPATARSRDQAWRLSFAWTPKGWRFGTDVARLRYSETDADDQRGRFRDYRSVTWQFSAERRLGPWRIALNHARGSAGRCELSGGVACSTVGLGGHQTTVGAMRQLDALTSVFVAAQRVHNAPGARYQSAPAGANADAIAVGIKIEFP